MTPHLEVIVICDIDVVVTVIPKLLLRLDYYNFGYTIIEELDKMTMSRRPSIDFAFADETDK